MALTKADICRAALRDLNVFDPTDTVSPDDLAFVSGKLDRIYDNWNAEAQAIFASQFLTNPLTPNLSPHTIGPTGTWVTSQRPVSIDGANLVLSSTNHPQTSIRVRDMYWYLSLSVPTIATSVPTDLYYEPDWPNGKLFFYPIPTTAYQVELLVRQLLTALALTDPFTLPPGYQDALTLTLSEDIASAYEKSVPAALAYKAEAARARVFANNTVVPNLATADAGIPRSGGNSAPGTYLTGWMGR